MIRKHQHATLCSSNQWSVLTWEDLEAWAGSRAVTRGQAYQRQNRVSGLGITQEGQLLATVKGAQDYITSVQMVSEPSDSQEAVEGALRSCCSCPVGYDGCKHAVAVVVEYLQRLADNAEVDEASASDARWAVFDIEPDQASNAQPSDSRIRQYIEDKNREELIALLESLIQRYPELHEEFTEQLMLKEGNADSLLLQARRELEAITAEPGWYNHWEDEGWIPDYSRLTRRLERLVELGDFSAVMDLGSEILDRGMEQIGISDDEGETAMALAECLPVVFEAVVRADCPSSEKLLFAIDAHLKDEFDVVGDATSALFDAQHAISDWSSVADALVQRLESMDKKTVDDFQLRFLRDHTTDWLARALEASDRAGEIGPIYEREARRTHSYRRLVGFLIDHKQYDEAEKWASEGIEETRVKWRGIASGLTDMLKELADLRGRQDIVVSYVAQRFFDHPSLRTFQELEAATRNLEDKTVQQHVRQATFRFLETGAAPVQITETKQQGRRPVLDSDWPLPVPDTLVASADLTRPKQQKPHYNVLLEIALVNGCTEDILCWYGLLSAGYTASSMGNRHLNTRYADRVAQAVTSTHPQKALEIYRQSLDGDLPIASRAAYESCAAYLRKMKPIMQSLDRADEWQQMIVEIREKYRRRPRFMEALDRLEDSTIIRTQRNQDKRR